MDWRSVREAEFVGFSALLFGDVDGYSPGWHHELDAVDAIQCRMSYVVRAEIYFGAGPFIFVPVALCSV